MEKKSPLPTKMTEEEYISQPKHHLEFLESKIDNDLGYYFWKKYIASAFWAQLSTPLNLAITMLTAITTAQSTSSGFLSREAYRDISITTLLITVINTFFNPLTQLNKNIEVMRSWNSLGTAYEEIYYDIGKYENPLEFIERYKVLQKEINELRETEGPESINFVTDFIHTISVCSCLRGYDKWLSNDRILMKQKMDVLAKRHGISSCCNDDGCCSISNIEEAAHDPLKPTRSNSQDAGTQDQGVEENPDENVKTEIKEEV